MELILILTALGIFSSYLLISFFSTKLSRIWFNKLYKAPELTMAFIFIIITAYPVIFFSLLREYFLKNETMKTIGFSIPNEVFKQLHVDKDDERRSESKLFFIGWGPLIGLHIPILIIWSLSWLYIIKALVNIL